MRRMFLALAVVAAACSGGGVVEVGGAETATSAAPPTSAPSTTSGDDSLGYRWQVGDCVVIEEPEDLPYEPYGPVVDCSEPHAYEVYYTGAFTEDHDAPFPEDLGERIREVCAAAFVEFTGVHLSQSALDVIFYLPDREEWASGLRYQACVAFDPRSGDEVPLIAGTLRGEAAELQRTPGECLARDSVRSPVVGCGTAHRGETIGGFTHPGASGDPYPGFDEYAAAADAGCATLLDDYVAEPRSATLALPFGFGSSLTATEWEAGLRTVPCIAIVLDAARTALPIVGSLAQAGWWVLQGGTTA